MTGKWKRILIVFVIVCLIGVGILDLHARFGRQVAYELINGEVAYVTLRNETCLVSGLRTRCTVPYSNFDPLPAHSTFLEFYKRTGLLEINGEESVLLTEAALASHLYPRWSPDGQILAYGNSDPNNPGICLADTDEKDEQCYREAVSRGVWNLSWSPDGSQIVFSAIQTPGTGSGRDLEGWAIYF